MIPMNNPFRTPGKLEEFTAKFMAEDDKKPLIKWFDKFEKALKKHGTNYQKSSINPTDAIEFYYDKKSPEEAAKALAEELQLEWKSNGGASRRVSGGDKRRTENKTTQPNTEVDEAESVPLVRTGQGDFKKDMHPSPTERLYQTKNKKEYENLMRDAEDAMRKGMLAKFGLVGNYKKFTVNIKFKDEKSRKKFEKMYGVKEGFASDAQRRAAFASGYKAKGKKKKEESVDMGESIEVDAPHADNLGIGAMQVEPSYTEDEKKLLDFINKNW